MTALKSIRKFRIGYYFDMFSYLLSDWQEEADFNLGLQPDFVEILLEHPGGCEGFSRDKCDSLLGFLSQIDVTAHAPTLNISLVAENHAIRQVSIEEHVHAIKAANMLKSPYLTLHGGEYPFYSRKDGRSPALLFNESIVPLLRESAVVGLQLLVENLAGKNIFPKTFDDLDRVLDANSNLSMALDVRHFIMSEIDPIEGLRRYSDRVCSIHYRVDCGLDRGQTKEFLQLLLASKFDGTFVIEDQALTTINKVDKLQILPGRQFIFELLAELEEENIRQSA